MAEPCSRRYVYVNTLPMGAKSHSWDLPEVAAGNWTSGPLKEVSTHNH